MSEYQYYEFLAIDRPLSKKEMAELRAISTRARITPTSFVNTYEWGDLKARPIVLVEKYFDAFFHLANWGTREFMCRLPREKVDLKALEPYCKGDSVTLTKSASFVIFSFGTDGEEAIEDDWTETGEGMLSSLLPNRESLLSGDLLSLYLRWLQRVQTEEIQEHVVEPPVPAGLGNLSGAQQALADLLRLDPALLEIAAEGALPSDAGDDVRHWLQRVAPEEKDEWLTRVIHDPGARADLVRNYRRAARQPDPGRRTVRDLRIAAERHRAVREKAAAEEMERKRKRYEAQQAEKREKRLKHLAAGGARAWDQVEASILQKPARYEDAVELLKDLKELCNREDRNSEFRRRIKDLRDKHSRKGNFIRRLDDAGLA